MRLRFLSQQCQLRILNSFLGVVVGWATAFVLVIVSSIGLFLYHYDPANFQTPFGLFVGWIGVLLMGAYWLIVALFISAGVSAAGWLVVGLPIALFIKHRLARSFWFAVPLHLAATIILFSLVTGTSPLRIIQQSDVFLYGWGLAIVIIGSAASCVFNRTIE